VIALTRSVRGRACDWRRLEAKKVNMPLWWWADSRLPSTFRGEGRIVLNILHIAMPCLKILSHILNLKGNNMSLEIFNKIKIFVKSLFSEKMVLIHTPKCAGTYLRKNYSIRWRINIECVGHRALRDLNFLANEKVVGLIRDPFDWYASYYYFCKKSLSKFPQSNNNFPFLIQYHSFQKMLPLTLNNLF
jgi:hypothetical protein